MELEKILSMGSDLAIIIGFIFAWYGIKRFIREKRLENANGNAWKVLELIDNAEDAIAVLFWANKRRQPDQGHEEILKDTISKLKRLYTGLLVLRKTSSEIPSYIDWLEQIIKGYERQKQKAVENNQPSHSISVDLLQSLGEASFLQQEPQFAKLETMRVCIASIAGLYHNDFE